MKETFHAVSLNERSEIAAEKMKNPPPKSDNVLSGLRTVSGLIGHLAAILFTAYIIYISKPGSSFFSWHPTLMSIAFTCLMVEAIFVFSPDSSLFLSSSRKTKVRIHWILQTSAVLCGAIGFAIIVINKTINGKDHFKSWHGIFGLITIIYCIVQASFGVLLLYPQVAKRWNWKLMQLKVYHATFGLLGFTLAVVTIVLSLYSNFVVANVKDIAWFICFVCPLWCGFIVMNQVTNTYLPITKKRPAPL